MGYTYITYRQALQNLVASTDPDPAFDTNLPSCIDYAEQRIYRELNLLNTIQTDLTSVTALGARSVNLASTFVAINSINLLTPAGSDTNTGTRVPLTPVSRDVLDLMWPSNALASQGQPSMYAMADQWSVILGAAPDGAYQLEVIGTYRPTPLSATNTATFLTDHLPDLFMAASMIQISGYMRNFSSAGSDPQMPVNWEQQYEKLLASAMLEEERKHLWSSAWSSQPPSASAGSSQRG